jgi:hypothetical protein
MMDLCIYSCKTDNHRDTSKAMQYHKCTRMGMFMHLIAKGATPNAIFHT